MVDQIKLAKKGLARSDRKKVFLFDKAKVWTFSTAVENFDDQFKMLAGLASNSGLFFSSYYALPVYHTSPAIRLR